MCSEMKWGRGFGVLCGLFCWIPVCVLDKLKMWRRCGRSETSLKLVGVLLLCRPTSWSRSGGPFRAGPLISETSLAFQPYGIDNDMGGRSFFRTSTLR